MAIKNTNFSSVTLQKELRSSLQTGTIPIGVTSTGSKYPINVGNVILNNPNTEFGPTAHPYYPLQFIFDDYKLQLDGDWSSKLKSGDVIELVRGSIRRDYTVQKNVIYSIGSTYSTLTLYSTREVPPLLDPFLGASGYPSVSPETNVLLNRRIENPNDQIFRLKSFETLMLTKTQDIFDLQVKWDIEPEVSATRLRWRSVPRNEQVSTLSFYVAIPGKYTQTPTHKIISSTGRSANIHLHCGVYDVTVASGGTGYTYATAEAIVADNEGGTGASFSVTLTGNSVSAVNVTAIGYDYHNPPNIIITGDGTGASAYVSIIELTNVYIEQQGGGYLSPPDVWIDPTYNAGSTVSVISVLSLENSGRVDYIRMLNGGSGYTGASVSLYGSYLADDATAEPVIVDGVITDIKVTYGGRGYTAAGVSIVPYGTGGTGASAKANIDIYSEWVYESPLYMEKETTISGFKYNIPYEIQILVSPNETFKGDLKYSSSVPFEYYKR